MNSFDATVSFRSVFATSLLLISLLVGFGCQAKDGEPARAGSEPGAPVADLSSIETLENGWASITTGTGTVCSDGSEYKFFVRPSDDSKVLVYLQGGGGCWTGETCSADRVGSFKATVQDDDPSKGGGIFELDNPNNPFKDHSMVYIPYCTGDVHLGDVEATYEVAALADPSTAKEGANPGAHEVMIHHRGHQNAMTVLAWVYENFDSPGQVFVTGSSAGSIPSPYYAAHLKTHYPTARVAQLGDGSGGYRRAKGLVKPEQSWGTLEAIDTLPEFQRIGDSDFDYEALYVAAGKAHPDVKFASYDTAEDSTQLRFLNLGGTAATSLQPLLDANLKEISTEVPNYSSYVAGGDLHVILPRPEFYTYSANGVSIRDWVHALANGEEVDSIHCQQCTTPELVIPRTTASTGG